MMLRSRILLIGAAAACVAAAALVVAIVPPSRSSPYPDSRNAARHRNFGFTRAYDVRRSRTELSGINLGCILKFTDYNRNPSGLVLDDYDLDAVRNAGFRHLRVSVEFLRYLDRTDGAYRLDPAMLARLDWILRSIVDRDMIAHLDFHELLPGEKLSFDSEEERWGNQRDFLAVWKLLSERYKAWPAGLYFELANEPHKPITPDVWNDYVRQALGIIRSSGGGNATRQVIVAVDELVPWHEVNGIRQLKIPPASEDPNLLVTFHYYQPFEFTWQGETFSAGVARYSKEWIGNTWDSTERQKAVIRKDLDTAARWGRENKRRIILGEFGVSTNADIVSQVSWTRFMRAEAESRGMIWLVWQLFDGPTIGALYNESLGYWRREILDALIPEDGQRIDQAAQAANSVPDAREVRERIAELESPDPGVRIRAAQSLRSAKPEAAAAVPSLAAALKDPEWQVRQSAARALAVMGSAAQPSVPALIAALDDEEWWVRKAAAQALGAMGPLAWPAAGKLVGLLGDEEWLVRKAVVSALSSIAPDDPSVLQALRPVLNDPEDQVRAAANLFLRTLEDKWE